jgi:hypothetical protein
MMYTLQGKPDQHTTHIPCLVHVWPWTIRISRAPHIATFWESSTGLDRCTTPKKKCSRLHLSVRLSGLQARLSFSSNTNTDAVRLSQAPVDDRLLGLLGPNHQHATSTFNTCSWGPTHRSFTYRGRGYNLGGAGLPHHTPWPSESTVLHFPPKGPARSQVINPAITKWTKEGTHNKSHEWEPPLDFYCKLTSGVFVYNFLPFFH